MIKLLPFLFFLPIISLAQQTYVPDDNFELALINEGFDFFLDDSVETQSIDTVTYLYIPNQGIADLTGIEEFSALRNFFCHSNQLTFLNLSNNTHLFEISCGNNQLVSLDVRNGNNQALWYYNSMNNPLLNCVDVDDVAWADYNWVKDIWTSFSNNCSTTELQSNLVLNKKLLKVVDIFGNTINQKRNTFLFQVYNDGTVKKRLILE